MREQFGFVRFLHMENINGLARNVSTILIGKYKLYATLTIINNILTNFIMGN